MIFNFSSFAQPEKLLLYVQSQCQCSSKRKKNFYRRIERCEFLFLLFHSRSLGFKRVREHILHTAFRSSFWGHYTRGEHMEAFSTHIFPVWNSFTPALCDCTFLKIIFIYLSVFCKKEVFEVLQRFFDEFYVYDAAMFAFSNLTTFRYALLH